MAEDTAVDGADAPVDAPEPERLHGALVSHRRGEPVLHPDREDLATLVRTLRDDHGYAMCLDVTAVDYLTYEGDRGLPDGVTPERFEVVAQLLSHPRNRRIRLVCEVPERDLSVPSVTATWRWSPSAMRDSALVGSPWLPVVMMQSSWSGSLSISFGWMSEPSGNVR